MQHRIAVGEPARRPLMQGEAVFGKQRRVHRLAQKGMGEAVVVAIVTRQRRVDEGVGGVSGRSRDGAACRAARAGR